MLLIIAHVLELFLELMEVYTGRLSLLPFAAFFIVLCHTYPVVS